MVVGSCGAEVVGLGMEEVGGVTSTGVGWMLGWGVEASVEEDFPHTRDSKVIQDMIKLISKFSIKLNLS